MCEDLVELAVKGATIQGWDLFPNRNVQLVAFFDYYFWWQFSAVKNLLFFLLSLQQPNLINLRSPNWQLVSVGIGQV